MATLHNQYRSGIRKGNERPNDILTRNEVISRGFSPIIGDPTMLPQPSSDPIEEYEIQDLRARNVDIDSTPLGEGEHAVIYKARYRSGADGEKNIVVKRSYAFRQAWAEVEALSSLSHKNIIKYYGMHRIDNRMYIYIQFSHLGDLASYMASEYSSQSPKEDDMFHLIRHIRDGLIFMHKQGYAHRDVKIHNILIFQRKYSYDPSKGNCKVICKLCDFGTARKYLSQHGTTRLESRTVIGSPKTMAPEVCDTPYNPFLADVYSLGVLLFQLSHKGDYPFILPEKTDRSETREEVREYAALKRSPNNIKWSSDPSQELRGLLQKMLEPDPSRRVNLNDMYETPWFLKFRRSKQGTYQRSSSLGRRQRSYSSPSNDGYSTDGYSSGSESDDDWD